MKKEVDEKIQIARHSLAHVLASAVKHLFKNVKIAIGPAIDNGFYYDFDIDESIVNDDFSKIEKEMKSILNSNLAFIRQEVSRKEAIEIFADEPYKVELINELPEGEIISIYRTGDFFDLCRGPHVDNTSRLQNWAFSIERCSGAYWKGDEKNKMLQRIYVYAFPSRKELNDYINLMEEAKKRDHRKLGKELGLFMLSEYAPGMPLYMPKGFVLRDLLVDYWKEIHYKAGYELIETPICMNKKLWEVSGHWAHYRDNMYSFEKDGEEFAIKPMNCPGGMIYYKDSIHSYREFPLRVGELGKVHRHEASGTLHGLMRVRSFTQDDAHIFMLPNQIESEVLAILDIVNEVYSVFGFKYTFELSTMPDDHIGEVEEWEFAEDALKNVLEKYGMEYAINEGDGAFYGPKIDIHIQDAIGRRWQCGTIQLDMQMATRFDLDYIDVDGSRKRPLILHRVIYGSLERIMGILIEHYAGAFPIWLAPVQAVVMNVSENSSEYSKQVYEKFRGMGIRVELDDRNEKIGYKIREASAMKVPYLIIIGDSEVDTNTISTRERGNVTRNNVDIDSVIEQINQKTISKE